MMTVVRFLLFGMEQIETLMAILSDVGSPLVQQPLVLSRAHPMQLIFMAKTHGKKLL